MKARSTAPMAPAERHATGGRLPIPPLSSPTFGLIQERTAREQFRFLMATILLNRTHGDRALPVFDEVMPDLEVAHLGGLGPYAYDSWRIFCRDVLLGLADDWDGAGATEPDFEPEWTRVHPVDKELSAFVRWMWLKRGWCWDPDTGARTALWWASLGEAELVAQPNFLRQLIEAAMSEQY
ncbi:putative methyl- binding domain-containing protein 4 protein [Neofusicoccum parvum UCRNP2]|uniref:Putative methyl-binding domain-containing protein 4 protein n=1 Tax=Botryosphaeria parva (strain UCR-NP2) TaxID=1287680 RepID=R1H3Z9_BOTPV|nr:putative methyl- binding domain-containing protein 4 protein [Neofusicoccum parvum UCRNP2]